VVRGCCVACDSGLRALTDFLNSPEFAADDADRGVTRERQALNVRTPYAAGTAVNDPVSLRKDDVP
jgi:hypothetical protein